MGRYHILNESVTKRRKDFKSEDAYLDYIYDLNKLKFAEVWGNNSRNIFKNVIKSYKEEENTNINGAIAKLERTHAFREPIYTYSENVRHGLRKYGAWKQFQNLTRDSKGRFTRFDQSKLLWDKENRMYVYDNRVSISYTNSPQSTILTDLATGREYIF